MAQLIELGMCGVMAALAWRQRERLHRAGRSDLQDLRYLAATVVLGAAIVLAVLYALAALAEPG